MTPPLDLRGDCATCGYPRFRREGHATWCALVHRQNEESCPRGRTRCTVAVCLTHMTHMPHRRVPNGSSWKRAA